ncbi:DUF3022 domain-containing protein [Paraburkholderia lycopersici]|uniref:DUF3022 domain-containing protein n=1 Tax=Paraburkholderia lycopersici TaxID=416944 RepID=A0A1G6SNW1_9BURK|nr:DUF3022 domain-containing protein [Paraburkholderia lycopersici]SDD18498.1 Protein of unknown function [Paraburkholderia lycopersici]
MNTFDFDQRIEEIQLAVADIFESPKRPAVSLIDEGETVIIQLSWVVESHRDTSLDARCAVTLRFARAQLERYARLDTARRRMIQQRIRERVRERFAARETPPAIQGDCSVEIVMDDSEFETPEGFL